MKKKDCIVLEKDKNDNKNQITYVRLDEKTASFVKDVSGKLKTSRSEAIRRILEYAWQHKVEVR